METSMILKKDNSCDSEQTPLTGHYNLGKKRVDSVHINERIIKPERSIATSPSNEYSDSNEIHMIYTAEEASESKKSPATFSLAVMSSILALVLCLFLLLSEISGFASLLRPQTTFDTQPNLFDELGRYIFEDYDSATPFSNFLPGLAGIYGKPLYAFFVNRGQGVASFGVGSKHEPILEYIPSNLAYERTSFVGFRTFIQGTRRRSGDFLSEPFSPLTTRYPNSGTHEEGPKRVMFSGENEMQIQETDFQNELETNVTYFILPEENFGAFVRRTTITNTHPKESVTLSILDGLVRMQPFGGEKMDSLLKDISNTLEAWMRVKFPYNNSITMPFYRLTSEPNDSASVKVFERGHYCLALSETKTNPTNMESTKLLPIVYDTDKIFGEDTTLLRPVELFSKSVQDIVRGPQYGMGKLSSCFAAVEQVSLNPGETVTISSFYGGTKKILDVPVIARRITQPGFVQYKLTRSRELIRQITASVETKTSNKLFDNHVQQMYLDNSLRGGIPVILGNDEDGILNADEDPRLKVYHIFSRIHGDLERDYNDFMLSPTFFSQGPGNFRDVAQNRRNDVAFNPRIGSFNIRVFLSFIQADGYEPLSVEAVIFQIQDLDLCTEIAAQAVGRADGHRAQREALSGILNNGPFRPGQLFSLMEEQNIDLIVSRQVFIDMVSSAAESIPMAEYKTGFWADHWTYYLDIIESYLSIYPDGEESLLYEKKLKFFFSPASVLPRRKKYVLSLSFDGSHKHVRQLGSTVEDEEKKKYKSRFVSNTTGWFTPRAFWQSDKDGNVFESDLIVKLFLLGTIKFSTRDPYGMGIEYEAGRPGWDDAHNGLPGMIGSGMPEVYELKALLVFLLRVTKKYQRPITVPSELSDLVDEINQSLDDLSGSFRCESNCLEVVPSKLFTYWDNVSTARESYRDKTKVVFSGETSTLESEKVEMFLSRCINEIDQGITRALNIGTRGFEDDGGSGITPTYFAYNVTNWRRTGDFSLDGHPLVEALGMAVLKFPLFLEGPTRMMKSVEPNTARKIYQKVKTSKLRDGDLGMYTISASLKGQPFDIGRSMAFPPGWLENQSVWLHMSYKFYLQLFRHNLVDEFYNEILSGGLVPFMDSQVYGRSLRECSSFIASSSFPDPSIRGRGFLPRLSGSTAEFLSMWVLMFIGQKPFFVDGITGKLRFQLLPSIPASLFQIVDDGGEQIPRVDFKMFSSINVRYYNEQNRDLFGVKPNRYRLGLHDGSIFEIEGFSIPSDLAEKIRRVVFVDFVEAHF